MFYDSLVVRRCARYPQLMHVIERSAGQSWSDVFALLTELVSGSFIREFLDDELVAVRKDSAESPPFSADDTVFLAGCSAFAAALKVFRPGAVGRKKAVHMAAYPYAGGIWCVGSGKLPLRKYRRSADGVCLISSGVVTLDPGAGMSWAPREELFYPDFDALFEPILALVAFDPKMPEFEQDLYDPQTLQRIDTVASWKGDSHAQLGINALAGLGASEEAETVRTIATDYPRAYVRWAAMKALIDLSPEAGVSLLKDKARGDDTELQQVATRSIQRLLAAGAGK
jgi:hypothetical protein